MALVYNYNEDVAAATFISGLQVIHSFYKHLVKNNVSKMKDILVRVQKYMQIEEVTRATTSRSHNSAAIYKPPRRARIQQGKCSGARPHSIQDNYRSCLQRHQKSALG